jgi:DNA-binding XRE family transcriptional regulator
MDPTAQFVAGIVGPTIRSIRREQELSQEALADYAEVHRTQITVIEQGCACPGSTP